MAPRGRPAPLSRATTASSSAPSSDASRAPPPPLGALGVAALSLDAVDVPPRIDRGHAKIISAAVRESADRRARRGNPGLQRCGRLLTRTRADVHAVSARARGGVPAQTDAAVAGCGAEAGGCCRRHGHGDRRRGRRCARGVRGDDRERIGAAGFEAADRIRSGCGGVDHGRAFVERVRIRTGARVPRNRDRRGAGLGMQPGGRSRRRHGLRFIGQRRHTETRDGRDRHVIELPRGQTGERRAVALDARGDRCGGFVPRGRT